MIRSVTSIVCLVFSFVELLTKRKRKEQVRKRKIDRTQTLGTEFENNEGLCDGFSYSIVTFEELCGLVRKRNPGQVQTVFLLISYLLTHCLVLCTVEYNNGSLLMDLFRTV